MNVFFLEFEDIRHKDTVNVVHHPWNTEVSEPEQREQRIWPAGLASSLRKGGKGKGGKGKTKGKTKDEAGKGKRPFLMPQPLLPDTARGLPRAVLFSPLAGSSAKGPQLHVPARQTGPTRPKLVGPPTGPGSSAKGPQLHVPARQAGPAQAKPARLPEGAKRPLAAVGATHGTGHAPRRNKRQVGVISCAIAGIYAVQTRATRKPRRSATLQKSMKVLQKVLPSDIVLPEPVLAEPSGRAVVWFRAGDLRSRDHCGLQAAATAPNGFLCCYIFESQELARLSSRRMALLQVAVGDLKSQLERHGILLHVLFAEDAAKTMHALCKEMKVTDIYVHQDPTDLRVESLDRLDALCGSDLLLHRWRAPLRAAVGSLCQCETHDDYISVVQPLETSEPLESLESNLVTNVETSETSKLKVPSHWQAEIPTLEQLRELLLTSSSREQLLFREKQKYSRGLGSDAATEDEAFRLLNLYVKEGAEAVAKDLWGAPGDVLPHSKEEWAFRRIALGPDGYKGLRPGEVFSRALAEEMLWLGKISLRSVAKELKAGSDGSARSDCQAALEALEANEWHRLLALADLDNKEYKRNVKPGNTGNGNVKDESVSRNVSRVRYFRWRGYLCRYIAPVEDCDSIPILAVHGFAASCMQFTGLAEALHFGREKPMPVYALDLIGFGHAEKPPLSITQYVWEQCVKDFLLGVVGRPAVLMGNSIGGYMTQSAAAFLGPDLCRGIVLLNSAGPLLSMEDYQKLLQSSGGTVLERMRKGYGEEAQLPQYAPPPQWLVDFGAWLLLSGLQPNIEGILKSLYPSNPTPVADLALEILRDSKDPFASNVIGCFSRLGPNRPTNELLKEYAAAGSSGSGSNRGHLLICQGMADLLGGGPENQPRRLQGFVSAVPELNASGVRIEGAGFKAEPQAPTPQLQEQQRTAQPKIVTMKVVLKPVVAEKLKQLNSRGVKLTPEALRGLAAADAKDAEVLMQALLSRGEVPNPSNFITASLANLAKRQAPKAEAPRRRKEVTGHPAGDPDHERLLALARESRQQGNLFYYFSEANERLKQQARDVHEQMKDREAGIADFFEELEALQQKERMARTQDVAAPREVGEDQPQAKNTMQKSAESPNARIEVAAEATEAAPVEQGHSVQHQPAAARAAPSAGASAARKVLPRGGPKGPKGPKGPGPVGSVGPVGPPAGGPGRAAPVAKVPGQGQPPKRRTADLSFERLAVQAKLFALNKQGIWAKQGKALDESALSALMQIEPEPLSRHSYLFVACDLWCAMTSASAAAMWDTGTIMFVALLLLFIWRFFFPFAFLTERIQQANYTFVLYALLLLLFIYNSVIFISTALEQDGKAGWSGLPKWLHPLTLSTTATYFITLLMCFVQSGQHLLLVRSGVAAKHHDQVLQVIALPAVYGGMAYSSMTRLYQFHVRSYVDTPSIMQLPQSQQENIAISRRECCNAAWTLYHFGKMTLDVVEASIQRQRQSSELDQQAEARGMLTSHAAVWAMVWASVMMFLLVSFTETGWLYLLNFASVNSTEEFDSSLTVFTGAGFVASGVALWNIAVVERTFHKNLEGYSPLLKFITVKILVSFAYFQKGCFYILQALQHTLPKETRFRSETEVDDLSEAHFELFYSTLMVSECFLVSGLHLIAWQASEDWYEKALIIDETSRLMPEKTEDKPPAVWKSSMRHVLRVLRWTYRALSSDSPRHILALRDALKIPALEQRLIYAGTQLEELVTPLWRQRRSTGALAAALGLDKLPDGAPLTLEHYGIQKGSVLNVVRKVSIDATRSAACAESLSRVSLPPGPPGPGPTGPPGPRPPGVPAGPSLAQLDELNDLELLVLLRPLLRKRPTLRAALLAEGDAAPYGAAVGATGPVGFPGSNGVQGPWQPGQRCLVWSNSAQRWCDGEVVQVAKELVDGKIPGGSVEVEARGVGLVDPSRYARDLAAEEEKVYPPS
eukprot:s1268_g13.t4